MEPIKPIRIFIIFFTVIIALAGLAWFNTDGGLFSIGNFEFRFFTRTDLTKPWPHEQVDISEIVEHQGELKPDSVSHEIQIDTAKIDSIQIKPAEVIIVKHKIQYPESNDTLLYTFFKALDAVADMGNLIRILHYGDSQIEGDRITEVIRNKFHQNTRFGGCGPGMLPVKDILQGRLSVKITQSDNWIRYSSFLKNQQEPPHNQFGLLSNWFRFIPYPEPDSLNPDSLKNMTVDSLPETILPDSLQADSIQIQTAWIALKKLNMGYGSTRHFDQFKIMLNNNPEPIGLKIIINETDSLEQTIEPVKNMVVKSFPMTNDFEKIKVEFSGTQSPDIYGFALDCEKGVAVDNIGLRGSAVVNFAAMDMQNLSRQIRLMNVKLVIMQFGVNVVPHVIENYNYYERMYYNQLMALKRAAPGLSILVIGVSDMSMKEGTHYVSYPNIEKIRNAQRNAARRAGCAFWDLYEAMGGKNAMVSWVNNDPPLAGNDYTHFTPKGSRIIGKMIYDAIMEEYYVYKKILH
jgi:lysophospholipase L1-like esterase